MDKLDQRTLKRLIALYPREAHNVNFQNILDTTLFIVGLGAFGSSIEMLSKLGVKRFILFENDIVEAKNLPSQNFTNNDVGRPKSEALTDRLKACEFEKGNPELPRLIIAALGDFLAISDDDLEKLILKEQSMGRKVILIFASDYHPVQARGNRLALKYGLTAFWVGIYTMGGAGEIIFYHPGFDLPCYRCITETRYNFFNKSRLADHLKGSRDGSGESSGLPFAASFIDSILNHIVLGAIHVGIQENPHGKLFRRLLKEKRNFIQCKLDPDYLLNNKEDIFPQVKGPELIAFNTIFQQAPCNPDCPDCNNAGNKFNWYHTDYTKKYK